MPLSEREEKLLQALVCMVDQYLLTYDGGRPQDRDEPLDSMAMSAGESAILALVDYGLMEDVTESRVMGRWTEAGKKRLLPASETTEAQAVTSANGGVTWTPVPWARALPRKWQEFVDFGPIRDFADRLMDEVWRPFDHAAVPRFYHADAVGHHRAQVLSVEDVVERLKWDRLNFKDPRYDIRDTIVDADMESFAIRFLYSCTLVATGERFTSEVNYFYRLQGGRISEFWLLSDKDFDYRAPQAADRPSDT